MTTATTATGTATAPGGTDAAQPTDLACLSVSGTGVSLARFEELSVARDQVQDTLLDLRQRAGADQLALLSTCERVEVYATWAGRARPGALTSALAGNRGVPPTVVDGASTVLVGRDAARHLLRVTAGLESFVLGESDIVGQVRTAAAASRTSGAGGPELERLLATAVNTSRRVHRDTRFGEGGRSVAAAAVHLAAAEHAGDLSGRRVLVVGAGQVATEVVGSAGRLGATVTVCNRTRRHAERLAAAGATVVDLGSLLEVLPTVDVAIFGTAAPQRLVHAPEVARTCGPRPRGTLVIDLCVPRNVDPGVGAVDGIRLVDLADLRSTGGVPDETVTRDVARAEQVVETELERFMRWLGARSVAASVRRLRDDVDACARTQVELATRGAPEALRPLLEDTVRRSVRQLAHGPTKRLLRAAAEGDDELVQVLAGLFASAPRDD